MPGQARGEVIDSNEIQILHCIERCVRKAWLCVTDPDTGEQEQTFQCQHKQPTSVSRLLRQGAIAKTSS